jgi:cystathionine gamma-lyase
MENPKYQATNEALENFKDLITQAQTEAATFHHSGFSTRCVHAGQPPEPVHGSVNIPIHMTSTYAQNAPAKPFGKFDYTRCGNPTSDALNQLVSALEYGEYSWTFASGCGATSCLFALWSSGDHVLVCDDVYGGTNRLVNKIMKPRFGLDIDMVDMTNFENVKNGIKDTTKMIWIETPTNPTLKLMDIEAICELANSKGIVTVVDNTFATPYNQNPLKLGASVAYNSMTKYIAGHSDVVAGSITTNDKELFDRIFFNAKSNQTFPNPFSPYNFLLKIFTQHL